MYTLNNGSSFWFRHKVLAFCWISRFLWKISAECQVKKKSEVCLKKSKISHQTNLHIWGKSRVKHHYQGNVKSLERIRMFTKRSIKTYLFIITALVFFDCNEINDQTKTRPWVMRPALCTPQTHCFILLVIQDSSRFSFAISISYWQMPPNMIDCMKRFYSAKYKYRITSMEVE